MGSQIRTQPTGLWVSDISDDFGSSSLAVGQTIVSRCSRTHTGPSSRRNGIVTRWDCQYKIFSRNTTNNKILSRKIRKSLVVYIKIRIYGVACTKGGEGGLHLSCGGFDSHRLHQFSRAISSPVILPQTTGRAA